MFWKKKKDTADSTPESLAPKDPPSITMPKKKSMSFTGTSSKVMIPTSKLNRSQSLPTPSPRGRIKSILKHKSVDESLHSTYGGVEGKESDSDNGIQRVHLAWKEIQIREFARTIGDNPSCSSGPPITISWDYDPETKVLPLDSYEQLRPPRRSHIEMILPREVRQSMLKKEWAITQGQIAAAVRANIKIKSQRRTTVQGLKRGNNYDEFFESASKGLKRGLLLKPSTDKEFEKLEKQMEAAEKARQQQHEINEMFDDDVSELQETAPRIELMADGEK